jgi:hypothetical protein
MKFAHFLLAAAVCAATTASAQTTPTTTPRGTGSAAPSAVPSGTPAPAANPKGAVSAGEVFTTGSPDGSKSGKRMKSKDSMPKGHDHSKMKAKAE